MATEPSVLTRADLARDLAAIGVANGDMVMVHAAMRRVGPLMNGPDALIGALGDVTGHNGTTLVSTDWDACYDDLLDAHGRVPAAWREHIPPYDPARSRAARDNGAIAEFVRTTPGAVRSRNPDCSVAAIGARADWLIAEQPLDYGHGPGSPMARLVEARGKVLMVGAPRDTITLLHHAEHLARVPGKRVRRKEVPMATPDGTCWRMNEEYESTEAIVEGLADDYFATIVTDYLATGQGRTGLIGRAPSLLLDAAAIVAFAVDWIERAVSPAGLRSRPETGTRPPPAPTT